MKTAEFCFGHHARVPAQLIAETEKPRALQILNHLLTLCSPQNPEVWIDQGLLGRKLGIHRDTVGRWVRHLEDVGRLAFLGFRNDGRRKRYLIKLPTEPQKAILKKAVPTPSNATSDDFVGRPPTKRSEDLRRLCRTINKEEETNKKEQTVVDLSKKEFSPNEKIALKQRLKIIGIHQHVIERLVGKYSAEKINAQIEHFQHVNERGGRVANPASWLISAIEKDYPLPKELDKKILDDDRQGDAMRKAILLAQSAKSELIAGNTQEALELSAKSALIAENHLAKEVHVEANQILQQAEKIEKARKMVSVEKQLLIRQEEEQKKLNEMRRWGKNDAQILASSFFKGAVEALVNERLLAAV